MSQYLVYSCFKQPWHLQRTIPNIKGIMGAPYLRCVPTNHCNDCNNMYPKSKDLTCIIAKIFNSMILNRIRGPIDSHLRDNQNGFRKNRSTLSHILALRRILEEARKNNLSVVLTFIDFKKAFDSTHRGKMIKILKAYGIPPRLLRAINAMYSGTRSKVMTPDGDTEEFEITASVLQGDTLAPFIFVIVLDYVLRKAISGRESEFGFMLTPSRVLPSAA